MGFCHVVPSEGKPPVEPTPDVHTCFQISKVFVTYSVYHGRNCCLPDAMRMIQMIRLSECIINLDPKTFSQKTTTVSLYQLENGVIL